MALDLTEARVAALKTMIANKTSVLETQITHFKVRAELSSACRCVHEVWVIGRKVSIARVEAIVAMLLNMRAGILLAA